MKKSIADLLASVTYLPNRTPEMAHTGEAEKAFAEVSTYRDGAIFVGYYSGGSDWERHSSGDEIVMALQGSTTLVLLIGGMEERVRLNESELCVVPANIWHKFEGSEKLKVMSVTPQPTDHQLERPE
jgi:mannose-6-phosphate isomerase-like protein (cupin superfamily)